MKGRRGVSELLGALLLLMITLVTFGVVTVAFYQQSGVATSNLLQEYRTGQIANGELLTLVYHSVSSNQVTLWLFNYGSAPVSLTNQNETSIFINSFPPPPNSVVQLCYSAGTASGGSSSSLADASQKWVNNEFAGGTVQITAGTGSGEASTIASNNATTLTLNAPWATAPDSTSVYSILSACLSRVINGQTWFQVQPKQLVEVEVSGSFSSPISILLFTGENKAYQWSL